MLHEAEHVPEPRLNWFRVCGVLKFWGLVYGLGPCVGTLAESPWCARCLLMCFPTSEAASPGQYLVMKGGEL